MFYQYTRYMDKVRNTSFFETFPEWEMLKEEFNDAQDEHLMTPNWWIDDKIPKNKRK